MDTRKFIIVMFDFAILTLLILYTWNFVEFIFAEAPVISQIGLMVGYCVLLFIALLGVAQYLVFLKMVLTGIFHVIAPLIIGAALTQFIVIYNIRFFEASEVGKLYAILLVIMFWFRGYYLAEFFSSRFPLNEHEIAKMVTSFPPRKFSDMGPFHCYMVFLLVLMPYIVNSIWLGI